MQWFQNLSRGGKAAVIGAAVAMGYFGYRWYSNYKASQSSTAAAGTSTTASQADESAQGFGASGSGFYGGGGGTGYTSPTTTSSGTTTATTGSTASTPSWNETTDSTGNSYYQLGTVTGQNFSGYNVSGNAPVYFGPPGGPLRTGLSASGIKALPPGTDVWVPTLYAADIAPTLATEKIS